MRRLGRTLEVLAWGAFFTLAAALLGLRYGVLPQVERYRPEIVARVAATVGLPVKIGRIEAEWLGLRPQINLSDVRIYDAEGREALRLPSIENILSWRSLAHGELRLHALRIEGPKLGIRRDASGAFTIAGIRLADSGEGGFGDWLLAQREIEIRGAEIEWRDDKRNAPPLVLSAINLRLTNAEGARHSISMVGRPPAALGTTIALRADLTGESIAQHSGWSGRAYGELGSTDVAAWRAWLDYPFEMHHGNGALRVWANVQAGAVGELSADFALADVAATLGPELPALELASLSAHLQARRIDGGGYEFDVRKLELTPQEGAALQPVDFRLAWKPQGGVAAANTLELAPLAHFAASLPLPPDLRRVVMEVDPRGQLADLRFEWQGTLAAPAHYRAVTRFAELGLKARDNIPGFARLAGSFDASDSGGRVQLEARSAELELPRVFPEPRLSFDLLTGDFEWHREGDRLDVQVPSLTFSNADVSGNAFGTYVYDGDGPGNIDVSAVLNRADARNLAHYLPLATLMGEKTREWLVKSIVAGQASDVEVRVQGDLREFPFAQPSQGKFRVAARVQNGELQYAPDWPRIQNVDAALVFERDHVEILGRSGTILGAKVHDVKVGIANLGVSPLRVQVSGQAQGPTSEFLRFLQASPLRASAGRFTEAITAWGEGRLRLRLDLPLAELSATRVAGEYEFADNRVILRGPLPPLEQAVGKLGFTDESFTLQELRGKMFGGSVAITGGTRPKGAIEFTARGDAQAAALATLFEHPLQRFISGSAPYAAIVNLREGLQRVVVDTTLRGVASTLPPPFEKAAAEALPVRVELTPSEGGARERVSVMVGRVAAAEIVRRREGDAMQLQRAALWFSPTAGQSMRMPERSRLLIYGSLGSVDADRWRAVLAESAGDSLATQVDMKLERLDLNGKRFNNVVVGALTDAAGWSAGVEADEIAGKLTYRGEGNGKLTARLSRFSVPESAGEEKSAATAGKPADLPALDLIAERFTLRGKQLGRLELVGQRAGVDWRIDRLALLNPEATLLGTGRWRDGVITTSELEFTLEAADVGQFLARAGYPGAVLGAKARFDGALRWHGELASLDYPSLAGEVRLNAEDGEFLEIDPGLGKLISLMNLQALPRRIALDFRDVFSKGFRFDRIEAGARLESGVMEIREFRMRGPAAEVAMSGKADLARETQNLRVRVVPSLGGSTATVVGIVNPVAGVAAALAQHVLKNPLGQIFAREFEVSGSWADPKVAKVGAVYTPMENATQ